MPVETTPSPPTPPRAEPVTQAADPIEKTIDLRAVAMVGREGRVDVKPVRDKTLDDFDYTLHVMQGKQGQLEPGSFGETVTRNLETAPKQADLRKVFVFAEILGGYDAFNDLTREDSPSFRLSLRYGKTVLHRELKPYEVGRLEEYHRELKQAIDNAKTYFRETRMEGLSVNEMTELYALVLKARDKTREITEILGKNLILQIERAVQRLYGIRQQILKVERTISGVFLVDDEVMFIPGNELIEAINLIFKGVGNPYLAGHIDGVLLLAARNLLIEVVSFYSYYGKHQIYQLFKHGQTVERKRVLLRIRNEVRSILNACKEDNKLVLTRIMRKEEEQLDLSIQAIEREASREAVEEVIRIFPRADPAPPPPPRKGWLRRVAGWLGLG